MSDKITPLNKQYSQIKNKYPDTVLLFRMGDFFETFNDDAKITSQVCGITLTKRNNGAAGEMPLAGFPHHQLDNYLPKLVKAGYRVAVCEQLEDPKKARGIVKRDVIEVVTPGVALYEKLLESKTNNYVAAITLKVERSGEIIVGASFCDISTGEYSVSEFPSEHFSEIIETMSPLEILISKSQKKEIEDLINKLTYKPAITKLEEWIFDVEFGREALLGHFKTHNLKGFGIDNYTVGIAAAGAILHYINETQKAQLPQIKRISIYNPLDYMTLDFATRRNLEIISSFAGKMTDGTLFSILDKTCTPMGGRLLKKWITMPLRKLDQIQNRLDAVEALFNSSEERNELRSLLAQFGDLERLITKVCMGRANPRDVVSLKNSLKLIPNIKLIINKLDIQSLHSLSAGMIPLNVLIEIIEDTLIDEPSAQLGQGTAFKSNHSKELDEYIDLKTSANDRIAAYQEKLRQESQISSLKVGFTSVFGYYIEVTNVHKNKIPDYFDRKQTLTNAERYTTAELKDIESKILHAEENISELEQRLFYELRIKIINYVDDIQKNAYRVAALDCLQSFSQISYEYNYVKPIINDSNDLDIVDGRHPVVERVLQIGETFSPNSTKMNNDEQIHIITGPNMSGKSCYLRQVGLIILLGQIGCFVPAKSAKFGLIDRIFTRVGAQDNITSGESTFLVEMQEAANILNNATPRSLILLDEVGRGTATFDGISIAWAIAEYIHDNIGAKTLFATHYHELNELADRYDRIINYKVDVVQVGASILFSHKVKVGASDHSFGIHVAQMAGLPTDIIERATSIMKTLEDTPSKENSPKANSSSNPTKSKKPDIASIRTRKRIEVPEQLSIFEFRDDILREKLIKIDINNLTPVEAFKMLSELVVEAKKK